MGRSAQTPETMMSDFNQDGFQIWQRFKHLHTGIPCQVVEVFPRAPGDAKTNRDGVSGLVHVRPAVEQFDNNEPPQTIHCGTIFNVPYFRLQGGIAGIIVDPEVGDWGWIHFGERDISRWKMTRTIEIPPTRRMFTQGDGGYFPGLMNDPPKIWIRVHKTGITVEAADQPVTVNARETTVNARENTINGNITVNGNIGVNGGLYVRDDSEIRGHVRVLNSITIQDDANIGGKSFNGHRHGGVENGGGVTGAPT